MRLVTFELTTPLGPVRRTGAIDGADHEFITQEADVVPGDLLGWGTIGMGCGFERDRYLTPGMTIELEAEGVGLLRNTLGNQTPPALRSAIGAPK